MNTATLRVLIAHGEPLIQMGLQSALNDCDDLQVQVTREPHGIPSDFDVAITDLGYAMKIARTLSAAPLPLLVVTNDESEFGIRGALEAGIRGYLLLNVTPDALAKAVRCVGRGGTAVDPRALTKVMDSLNSNKLTVREIDVLRLVVKGRSNKVVAAELGIAIGTVKSHVKQLMAKLNARCRTEAASIAQRRGLVPPEPEAISPASSRAGRRASASAASTLRMRAGAPTG